MLPLLELVSDGQEYTLRTASDQLSEHFQLTEIDRKELLPSGQESRFDNRVGWARTHLKKAGLVEYPRRGFFRITDRGLNVLQQHLKKIDCNFLKKFQEYQEFIGISNKRPTEKAELKSGVVDTITPEETLESIHQRLRESLAEDILEMIRSCSPTFFERMVIDLLVKMGYGGSRKEAGQAIGGSGDGGIDGIIKEDRLGLDIIYIQAKRWEGKVGRPEIQKFAGALLGQQARKGIFITTSQFSREAVDYVNTIDAKIILIDSKMLGELMIDYNVGVSTFKTYEIKRIDSDYFSE